MKVVILAGGLGTRLREETEFRPKPMILIGGKPILWHIMKIYATQGFSDFIIALGYKGETIKNYFYHYELHNNDVTIELGKPDRFQIHQCHDECGWRITLADTGQETLKGARLMKLRKYIGDEPFMLTYGDGVANIDLKALAAFHTAHGKLATVTGINPASRFGELKVDGSRVTSFMEKPEETHTLASGGFFVLNPGFFDYLSDAEDCDLEKGPLEDAARDSQLMVYRHERFWCCMDTYRDVEYLNALWREGKADWKLW